MVNSVLNGVVGTGAWVWRLVLLWPVRSALLGSAAILIGLGIGFRDPIRDGYLSFQESAVIYFGLGVIPLTVWVAVFAWTAVRHRIWFLRFRLWLGSLGLLALAMGVLAFFGPSGGFLGEFTLDGEIRLGGKVGRAIIGPVGESSGAIPYWAGAMRALLLSVLVTSVALPTLAADAAVALGKFGFFLYLTLILAVKALASWLRRIYQTYLGTRLAARKNISETPAEGTFPSSSVAEDVETVASTGTLEVPSPAALSASLMEDEESEIEELDGRDDSVFDPSRAPAKPLEYPALPASEAGLPALPEGDREVQEPQPVAGKFNRYWTEASEDSEASSSQSYEVVEVVEAGDGNEVATDASGDMEERTEDERDDMPILGPAEDVWTKPSIDTLLDAPEDGISPEDMDETAHIIKGTLADYGVEVDIGQIRPGPTVTMYGLIPGWVRRYRQVKERNDDGTARLDESGKQVVTRVEEKTRVKVDSILSREKDLALALKTPSIRIETPVMGESQVGIEVPNPNPNLVTLRSAMESDVFKRIKAGAHLPVALGKGSHGETVSADLAKMPHLLIAGATGSGKSVCINSIVSCLIMEKTPAELRLLLIDPKRVELTPYNGIPHLLTPVIVETDQVVGYLKGMIREMFNRYRLMEEVGVKNIDAYNKKMPEKMPLLVVAVDELADLMMTAAFDVEQSLCRLAQLGRATGIHLIVATQRPSVDVVTGLIKANFPTRISFGVTSQIDSRTILDTVGADKLLGRGDMLYLPLDASRPARVQGVYISDLEVGDLVRFWQNTHWPPLPKVPLAPVRNEGDGGVESENGKGGVLRDEMMDKAIELSNHYNKLSTSLLQRRLRIGYPRAGRLMDQLEEAGVVGPSDGSKSRDVIINGR